MKILKFYTQSCSQCKQQDRLLKDFTDIEIVPVDCDENEDLVDLYSIRSLPTLILIDNNKVISRHTGITQIDVIRKVINDYINT